LSLKRATCAFFTSHTSSITSHNIKRPAISKLELVIVPSGLASGTMLSEMSRGHWSRKTTGAGTALCSPMMTPPRPCPDASVMPTKSGQPVTKFLHLVGELTVSRRNVRQLT
jgi:hypothetical protein